MITPQDIDNLAELSRLELSDEEKTGYAKDLNRILEYVAEIQKVYINDVVMHDEKMLNIMRDDVVTTETGSNTEVLVNSAPEHKDGYIKVKKVL